MKIVKEKLIPYQKDLKATVSVIGQSVRVTCEKQDTLDQIKDFIRDEHTVITDRTMLKPQIKVVGVQDYDQDSFVLAINEYNEGILGEESRVVSTMKGRDRDKTDVIIETTGLIQTRTLNKGSLLHGFNSHRVYEHLQLRQCVRCLGLGHKKDQCKVCAKCLKPGCRSDTCSARIKNLCFKCGGDHLRKDCRSNAPKCSVCLHHGRLINGKHTKDHANHPMLGRDCPLRIQGEAALKKRTEYGQ